jgi:arylsulfatase A
MAREGLRFTDFYVAAAVCSPSRAALLTGRYPVRNGMFGARNVLYPDSKGGLPANELSFATALKKRGYATGQVGKWHLGIHPGSTPRDHGFDASFGLPYSNDMDPKPDLPRRSAISEDPPPDGWTFPLLRDGKLVEQPVDQTTLTRRYTQAATDFIREHKSGPFVLYFAHTFPHTPLFASPEFKGRSLRGRYGDTVEELDWSVGQVLAALRTAGVAENTLVFFTSDNGPWLTQNVQGGSAGLLREGKGSTWEGGMRVPGIAWWPGRIRPGVTSTPASTLDLFATVLTLGAAPLPNDRPIDGLDLSPVLFEGKPLPDRPFFYYRKDRLAACRLGNFKLHFFTQNGYGQPKADMHDVPLLFNLARDPGETYNIAAQHPQELERIRAAIAVHREKLVVGKPQF